MTETIIAIVQCLLLVVLAPLVSGTGRWMRAKMHTRRGPSILQDYYDIFKLLKRQDVHTADSSFISRLMPPLFFGTMLVLACGMPMIGRSCPVPWLGDIVTIIYLLALPRFFFALSGVDSSNAYAGVGSMRELIVGVLVEPSLMLALLVAALAAGSTNIGEIGIVIGSFQTGSPVAVVVAGIAFAVACYIELGKLPYDMAEAEQEIQEGPLAEYSGPSLAMVKMSLSMKQIIMVSLFLAIFLPFGSAVDLTWPALVSGFVAYLVKLAIVFFICALVENLVARVRYRLLGRQTWTVVGVSVLAFVFCVLGV